MLEIPTLTVIKSDKFVNIDISKKKYDLHKNLGSWLSFLIAIEHAYTSFLSTSYLLMHGIFCSIAFLFFVFEVKV